MRERLADALEEALGLCEVEGRRRAQGMDLRPPQRLVRIDVPHARKDALVEQDGFDRRPSPGEERLDRLCGEPAVEQFFPHSGREIRLELSRLQQQPGAEAADVTVGDVRSVV